MQIDTIVVGDCLDVMAEMPDRCVDLVIADLPSEKTGCDWDSLIPLTPLWEQYKRITKRNAAIVLFGTQPFTSKLIISNLDWFRYCWIWEKDNSGNPALAKIQPLRYHEDIAVFYESQPTYNPQMWDAGFISNKAGTVRHFGAPGTKMFDGYEGHGTTLRYPKSVLKFNKPKANTGLIHPTQKPVELVEYLIRTYSNGGDLTLDNVIGSGTTAVAALKLGRHFYGCDINQDYVDLANERIEKAKLEMAQLEMAL